MYLVIIVYYIESYFCVFIFRFCGSRAILSGPAGGVVGFSKTTYNTHTKLPVIGFDMGGISLFFK